MAENYQWSSSGKYYDLYISSRQNTTIYIQVGGSGSISRPVKKDSVLTFRIPLAWELKESGTIEKKAIHVWSEDADLSAYVLSRNPATSDGMYVIPTIGWGKEYVVASYHSHWAGAAGGDGDLPSEFAMVANTDSTVITVLPTTAIRRGQDADVQLYPAGVPFTVVLDRGEAVQYQAMRNDAQAEGYDFTGTRVVANKPIGVIGGHMCANVPVEFPWCDHLCDMIPPVRSWGSVYYTAPLAARKGGDTYLVIASKDSQAIYRTGVGGRRLHTTLNKFGYYFRPDIEDASRWESDAPFLLAQYCNSTSWPGYPTTITNNGIGDPAFVVITPHEQRTKQLLFQTPTIATGGSSYYNYLHLAVQREALATTVLNGASLTSYGGVYIPIDSSWGIYRLAKAAPGAHVVDSDSGVTAYLYGYGSYDSYAWAGALGVTPTTSADTTPPFISTTYSCNRVLANVSDLGYSDGLNSIVIETQQNFLTVLPFGDPSHYELQVANPERPAFARVKIRDLAGNSAIAEHRYVGSGIVLSEEVIVEPPRWADTVFNVSIRNNGTRPLKKVEVALASGAKGFSILRAPAATIPASSTDSVTLEFRSRGLVALDSVIIRDSCGERMVTLTATLGPIVLSLGGPLEFGTVRVGDSATRILNIRNISRDTALIFNAWIDDLRFYIDPSWFPLTIPPDSVAAIPVVFRPNIAQDWDRKLTVELLPTTKFTTRVRARSVDDLAVDNQTPPVQNLQLYPNPTKTEVTFRLPGFAGRPECRLFDASGSLVQRLPDLQQEHDSFKLTVAPLPAGVYTLEVLAAGRTYRGKIILVK